MAEYIERKAAIDAITEVYYDTPSINLTAEKFETAINGIPAVDIDRLTASQFKRMAVQLGYEQVVRCRDCKHSTLPSMHTQIYGKPGTLTCHNRKSPCNNRNVASEDYCKRGEREEE